jgi:hypothetical protein
VWLPLKLPYAQVLAILIRWRMKHVRLAPFPPLRVLCRHLVTRPRLINRSIEHQYLCALEEQNAKTH